MTPTPDSVREPDAAPRLEEAEIGRIFREESGRSGGSLIRVVGDIDLAEDAVQEGFAVGLCQWARQASAACEGPVELRPMQGE